MRSISPSAQLEEEDGALRAGGDAVLAAMMWRGGLAATLCLLR